MKTIDRKNSSVKELQAECKKRKIGFMATWTKLALIKRLEEEDVREETLNKTKEELTKTQKDINKVKKELDSFEGARKPDDIKAALLGERKQAQDNYDKIKMKIDDASALKAALSIKYDEAAARLKNIDDAVRTLERVL